MARAGACQQLPGTKGRILRAPHQRESGNRRRALIDTGYVGRYRKASDAAMHVQNGERQAWHVCRGATGLAMLCSSLCVKEPCRLVLCLSENMRWRPQGRLLERAG